MTDSLRQFDIKFLKGVGPSRADLLARELGIHTYHDMLYHFPSHYVDRSRFYAIREFAGQMPAVQVRGRFVTFTVQGEGAKTRLVGLFSDSRSTMEVVWFSRIKKLREVYHVNTDYVLFGRPAEFNGHWSMVHPEVEQYGTSQATTGLRGVYPLSEKLRTRSIGSRQLYGYIRAILDSKIQIGEILPQDVVARYRLMPRADALRAIHSPSDNTELQRATERLKFEELYMLQLNIVRTGRGRKEQSRGIPFMRIGRYFNSFYREFLPFPLTGAQKRVIREIRADMGSGRQMNRLLQGDVGSGKTLVALMCMLIALDNDTQACMMAPTEILAAQHFETISQMLAPIGINVRLLTGSTRPAERREIHEQLMDGSLHILIGTHAVIEDAVQWRNLGFVVVDEQHRFGVMQRARMWGKNSIPPHILVMTATPIPRTLAMTVYGDLDVSVIDELPPGRKPVVTLLRHDTARVGVYQAIGRQLKEGRQAYIVYPLITENEKLDLRSLEEGFEYTKAMFPHYRVVMVHGRMKPAEKDYQMQLFATHQADILVATTVIEVGVNVPNATTMVIENAERFGLAQLHQLRGRVGRGGGQSYCVLMTKTKIAADTRKRLELMTQTSDGFVIAEADMRMRGPGDIEGTMQSGIPFDLRIASLSTDGSILAIAREAAERTLDADPQLTAPEHQATARELALATPRPVNLSRIS